MDEEKLRSTLYLRSALPLAKVLREEDFKDLYDKLHYGFNAVVQFRVAGEDEPATHLVFKDGGLDVGFGLHQAPTVTFSFGSFESLNGFFAGKMGIAYLPGIKPLWRMDVVLRVLPLLLQLKILDPKNLPTDLKKQTLKVKMLLYMVTNALSQLNQAGDEHMVEWTGDQPDRIYQWTVKDGPAAYLRVKGGKTKAGRGVYERKRPFVLMAFKDIQGAFMVLTSQAELVEAVSKGFVVTEGALEYSKDIGEYMQRIELLLQ